MKSHQQVKTKNPSNQKRQVDPRGKRRSKVRKNK